MAEPIHEHTTHVRAPGGPTFVARMYGEERPDGTWIGWLEFAPINNQISKLRTDRVAMAHELPSARVAVGAELHDSTDSGILIFVPKNLLDRRECVLTAAVARCDPLNLVDIV